MDKEPLQFWAAVQGELGGMHINSSLAMLQASCIIEDMAAWHCLMLLKRNQSVSLLLVTCWLECLMLLLHLQLQTALYNWSEVEAIAKKRREVSCCLQSDLNAISCSTARCGSCVMLQLLRAHTQSTYAGRRAQGTSTYEAQRSAKYISSVFLQVALSMPQLVLPAVEHFWSSAAHSYVAHSSQHHEVCNCLHASAMQAAEAKQQRRRNKQLAQQQRRKQAAHTAKGVVSSFSSLKRSCSSEDKHGDVKLPDAVLQKVISCLAGFEPDRVRGPSMAAGDLANAALVSGAAHKLASGMCCCIGVEDSQGKLVAHLRVPACVVDKQHTSKQNMLLPPCCCR
jgi:hypothetical protein